jgi:tetratricopeptide (TPR) repeat protein
MDTAPPQRHISLPRRGLGLEAPTAPGGVPSARAQAGRVQSLTMDRASPRGGYSTREVASLLSLSPAQVRACVRAGFVTPLAGPHGELLFSFQDLVLLRTAKSLLAAHIPRRRIRAALLGLHAQLPQGRPLTGVRISAQGGTVVARDGGEAWQPESGQTLLDFEVSDLARQASALRAELAVPQTDPAAPRADGETPPADPTACDTLPADPATPRGSRARRTGRNTPPAALSSPPTLADRAADWYERGVQLEADDPGAARAAYLRALDLDPDLADAHLNLGRLLHEASNPAGAEIHYRQALAVRPADPLAAYNLGVALQDQRRLAEAVAAYLMALDLEATFADAHFNLSGVYEQLGDQAAAFRHLRTYRSLIGRRGI